MEFVDGIGPDRRRYGRRSHRHYAWIDMGVGMMGRATTTVDLGVEGARFQTVDAIPVGTRLLVHLQVGQGHRDLECKGKICWVGTGADGMQEYGVRFVDLTEEEYALLNGFLEAEAVAV